MGDGIYTALSGAIAQEHALDVVANNVANASTAGFRADRVVFGQMLAGAQRGEQGDPRQPQPAAVTDKFVRVDRDQLDLSSGALRPTGNALDLAINGDGFFQVRMPEGDRLTRAGSFMLAEDGRLTTVGGGLVLDENGQEIQFRPRVKEIKIAQDGSIRADGEEVAKLAVRTVADPAELTREGTTMYALKSGAQLTPPARAEVVQGHLESSNVNPMMGLNELITINRSFDALQRVIQTFQQMDQRTARDVGSRG